MSDDIITLHGIYFIRCPMHENRLGRWEHVAYSGGMVCTIRIDSLSVTRCECTISVGPAVDSRRLKKLELQLVGRGKLQTLLEALDLARYPMQVAGFGKLVDP